MQYKHLLKIVVALAVSSTQLVAAQHPDDLQRGATEVCFVATQHFVTDMPDGYTPGHLRALLKKLSPQVIAVEAPSNVPNPWDLAPLELAKVTKPWADKHGVVAIPVGWNDESYQTQLSSMLAGLHKYADYARVEQDFQKGAAAQPVTCAFMNSKKAQGLWRKYHAGLHDLYGGDTPWETWNAKILGNVLKVCRENPRKRVAVVIGWPHCYYLEDQLKKEKGLKLIPTEQFLPLSKEEVKAETQPRDYVLALRLLNYPSVIPAQLDRLEPLLEKIKDVPEFQGDYHLFRGKLRLHRREFGPAIEEFSTVAALDEKAISAYDGQTRLREAGKVYQAIAMSQKGEVTAAKKELQDVIAAAETKTDTRKWASQVLAQIAKEQENR